MVDAFFIRKGVLRKHKTNASYTLTERKNKGEC
jgi:hypothetical protein